MSKDDGLIGTGFQELCNEVGKQLERDAPLEEQARRREEETYRYSQGTIKYVQAQSVPGGVVVSTIDELYPVGHLSGAGPAVGNALAELRYNYASALFKMGLMTWPEARAYTYRFDFRLSDSVILTP